MANMKVVYTLTKALADHPDWVESAQRATLDKNRPLVGLRGKNGLYGSPQWWASIADGRILTAEYKGVIRRLFVAGMDSGPADNSFEIESNDGGRFRWGILADEEADKALYKVGQWAEIVTLFDELKRPNADGSPQYLEEPLQISLSADA